MNVKFRPHTYRISPLFIPTIKCRLQHHIGSIYHVSFHKTLSLLVTGSRDCTTIVYDISTMPPVIKHHLKDHKNDVLGAVFHPTLPLLMTSSCDKTVILYNLTKM